MNSESKFTPTNWANGKPSIDIDPYTHSPDGFDLILKRLTDNFEIDSAPKADVIGPDFIPELHNYWAELTIDHEEVIVAMDEFTCSVACDTEDLRDQILKVLKS